jgi:aldose 1-epimerase
MFTSARKALLPAALLCLATIATAETKVSKADFGKMPDGTLVELYTISDGKLEAKVITYGGILTELKAPDKNGAMADVVLGFDNLDDYVKKNDPHFGGTIGRYANRIAHGQFQLDGKTYNIPKNNGENALHGGPIGFDKHVWQAKQISKGVELTYLSPDGDQGFPGNMKTIVRYTIEGDALKIDYSATTDKDTVVNLTNHSYFNLKGEGSGDTLQHKLQIHAQRYTPVDENLIPTGELAPVKDTPFDFQLPHAVGERINVPDSQLKLGVGYDHNYVLENNGKLTKIAEAYESESGRVLSVLTTEPGVQFYSANHLDGVKGKHGHTYNKNEAICLETQHYPDSPNHPAFPSTELKAGKTFHSTTVYQLSVRK